MALLVANEVAELISSASAPGEHVPAAKDARRSRWWIELAVVVWLCWVYDMIANLAPVRERLAMANAASILRIETALHIDPEAALDQWLAAHHSLAVIVSNYYDNAHFVVTLGVLGWIWWRAPIALYRPLRNNLVLINVIGMLVFWVLPTAPPAYSIRPGSPMSSPAPMLSALGTRAPSLEWPTSSRRCPRCTCPGPCGPLSPCGGSRAPDGAGGSPCGPTPPSQR